VFADGDRDCIACAALASLIKQESAFEATCGGGPRRIEAAVHAEQQLRWMGVQPPTSQKRIANIATSTDAITA